MEIIRFIQTFSNPFWDGLFQFITMLGEDYVFILILTLIYWCVNKKLGYRLGFAYLISGIFNIALKEIFHVPRPIGQPGIRSLRVETAGGYSFPSGHTQCTATLWTTLISQIKKTWMFFLGVIVIFLVAFSRLYLGVHTPLDVTAGAIIGIILAFFSGWLIDYTERTGKQWGLLIMVVPTSAALWLFPTPDYFKVLGVVLSFYIGYLIETRYIVFETHATIRRQFLKYFLGIIVLLLIKEVFKYLLPDKPSSDFIRYFLIGLWVTTGAPYLFKLIFRKPT